MKKLKTLIPLLLLLVCLQPLSIAAAERITIHPNGETGEPGRFKAYQVFSGTLAGDALDDIAWGNGVKICGNDTHDGCTAENCLIKALMESQLPIDSGVFGEAFTASWNAWHSEYAGLVTEAEFVSQWLTARKDDPQVADAFARIAAGLTQGDGTVSTKPADDWIIDVPSPGYWLIVDTATDGAVSSDILAVLGEHEIDLKATLPVVEKQVAAGGDPGDGALAGTDETLTFTLTGTVAENIGEFSTYAYKFTDTLSAGLTADTAGLTVQLWTDGSEKGAFELTTDYTVELSQEPEGQQHTLTVDFPDLKASIARIAPDLDLLDPDSLATILSIQVKVTYQAQLNPYATAGSTGNLNSVTLTYANNPYAAGTGETAPDEAKVFTLALRISKADNEGTPMSDVQFIIKNQDGNYATAVQGTEADLQPWVVTAWNQDQSSGATRMTPDAQGRLDIHGLEPGTYTLEEVATREGFRLMKPVEFTISAKDAEDGNQDGILDDTGELDIQIETDAENRRDITWTQNNFSDHGTVSVANFPEPKAPILPNTGVTGTNLAVAAGIGIAAVCLLAVVFILYRKKEKKRPEDK